MRRWIVLVSVCAACGGATVHEDTATPARVHRARKVHLASPPQALAPPAQPSKRAAAHYLKEAIDAVENGSVQFAHATMEARERHDEPALSCLDAKRDALEDVLEFLETRTIADDAAKRDDTLRRVHSAWTQALELVRVARDCG